MVWRRSLTILGMATAMAAMLPGQGWAQEISSIRALGTLFYDLLLIVPAAGAVIGLATGISLRWLPHRPNKPYPSRVRSYAFFAGGILTVVCEGLFIGLGVWRNIDLASVVTYAKGMLLIPLLFALSWYVATYVSMRVSRWSGSYALWPHRLTGDRS